MSLVHRLEEVDLDALVALRCPHCRIRHRGPQLVEVLELGGDLLQCPDCLASGLEASYWGTVEERFPAAVAGEFVQIPTALFAHASSLGLHSADILVVVALDRHRAAWGHVVYPSEATIATEASLSVYQVRRALTRLSDAKLIARRPRVIRGVRKGTVYDTRPLWERLASLTASTPTAQDRELHLDRTAQDREVRSNPTAQICTSQLRESARANCAETAPERDTGERDPEKEIFPTGSTTARNDSAQLDDTTRGGARSRDCDKADINADLTRRRQHAAQPADDTDAKDEESDSEDSGDFFIRQVRAYLHDHPRAKFLDATTAIKAEREQVAA